METLLKAIRAKYVATAALVTAAPGGMWFQTAPQNITAGAYIVFFPVAPATIEYSMTANTQIADVTIQFNIFADTVDLVKTARDAFETAYNNVLLTLDGTARVLLAQRRAESLVRDGDGEGFQQIMEYKYLFGE